MHVLIPFAAPGSEAGREALRSLQLPQLQGLLAGRSGPRDEADELSLSPPHERALARAWGWQGADGQLPDGQLHDGQLPFAAELARGDGIDPGHQPWGLLTPVHWHLGTDQVSMTDPAALLLDADTSRALLAAVAELFTSEGFVIRWGAPMRWYLSHESLAGLATASPDRVIGRNVDRWLPAAAQARLIRRLQSEVQMLLYTHPINAEREARGQPTVNACWLSGCGVAQPVQLAAPLRVEPRLRSLALAEDWPGWAKAWQQIDSELPALAPARITLCGEKASLDVALPPRGLVQRLAARLSSFDLVHELERL